MRRLFALFLVAILALSAGIVSAQDNEVVVIELPDVLVICPGESVLPSVRDVARLIVDFQRADDVLVVPVGVLSQVNGGAVVTIGRITLSCDATADQIATIDRSPAVGINETAPNPENLPGVAETQAGYLVVTTLNANLRSCDQPTCTRVAIVNSSEFLVALGTNGEVGDRLWWYVQVDNIRGWIWGDLVAIRGNLGDVPVIGTEGEPSQATVYIGYTGNLIYDSLDGSGRAICGVQAADNYPLLGRNSDTTWVYVEAQCIDGSTVQGWMDASNVAIRNTGSVFVPFLNADGTPR